MGRYHPPQPESSPYITAEGYQCLQDELAGLWRKRAEVVQALSAAAAEGDRSENAEYIYRKKELAGCDRRIRYLQKRLPNMQVVRGPPQEQRRIFFGAWVRLADVKGSERVYRIVGPDEFDLQQDYISIDSPLARALLKKGVDEEVLVQTPQGAAMYEVVGISYAGNVWDSSDNAFSI